MLQTIPNDHHGRVFEHRGGLKQVVFQTLPLISAPVPLRKTADQIAFRLIIEPKVDDLLHKNVLTGRFGPKPFFNPNCYPCHLRGVNLIFGQVWVKGGRSRAPRKLREARQAGYDSLTNAVCRGKIVLVWSDIPEG
jgi:hypothetical protein